MYIEAGFLESKFSITFVQDSPVVHGHDISVYVEANNPMKSLDCRINDEGYKNCKSQW